jgi:uncharacterized cupredoxin-like copper-binding protein
MNRRWIVSLIPIVLVVAACGGGDEGPTASDADRTVEIDMVDVAFKPENVEVRAGETVRFVLHNRGKVVHDAFVGDSEAQEDHETQMRDAEEGGHNGHGGDEEDALTVDPGETGELTHTFDEAGRHEIGCHQPGHYAAGMKITVAVG